MKCRLVNVICCLLFPLLVIAQPNDPDDTPVDGGLCLLLVSGVGVAYKRLKSVKK